MHSFFILNMLVYNITFHIEEDILQECLEFLKKEYIPQATRSGFLHSPCMRRIFPYDEGEKTNSYAIQFHVKNIDTLNLWIENEGRGISQKLIDRFGRKVVGFTTLLEEIDL